MVRPTATTVLAMRVTYSCLAIVLGAACLPGSPQEASEVRERCPGTGQPCVRREPVSPGRYTARFCASREADPQLHDVLNPECVDRPFAVPFEVGQLVETFRL